MATTATSNFSSSFNLHTIEYFSLRRIHPSGSPLQKRASLSYDTTNAQLHFRFSLLPPPSSLIYSSSPAKPVPVIEFCLWNLFFRRWGMSPSHHLFHHCLDWVLRAPIWLSWFSWSLPFSYGCLHLVVVLLGLNDVGCSSLLCESVVQVLRWSWPSHQTALPGWWGVDRAGLWLHRLCGTNLRFSVRLRLSSR